MEDIIKKIYDYSLEDIMGERFGRYAKSIIQDRAIPDVRDGLKPVQRRILYAMYKAGNTCDKPYKKCGETVGEVMGKYHPHGDSSIYEAMVRMSQWWKQNAVYIDMHGNNGSMDGDSAAAYRYTEARLSAISNELLVDIKKDTVLWAPNYADTLMEPIVLPCKYPNLLVNGATGISAGYATNIPPHNLGEIIDATIKRIDNPNCRLDTLLDIVKGPDFPTGATAMGKQGIKDAYETGRGKIIISCKREFQKNGKIDQLVISEIPFDVNKAALVRRIDEIRIDKKIEGISEIRDESDREDPVRIVIDLKPSADKELVLNYLLKNTDMQISYNFNMVAIVHNRPYTLGLIPMLDAYIEHLEDIIKKRTKFDLDLALKQVHIVDGLIKALGILDDVIKVIRQSKNKGDAKDNLVKSFAFSEVQADAIVMLQLYRLTNTDVTMLLEEAKKLKEEIKKLQEILDEDEKLKNVMKNELKQIKKDYAGPRKTKIEDEIEEIKIDTTQMIPKEDVIVTVTSDGYVKRVSIRSYNNSEDDTNIKDGDYLISLIQMNTLDTLLLFTNKGNYLYLPVYELPDLKWKELGKHISNIIKIEADEQIVKAIPAYDFEKENYITLFTKNGMVKRTKLSDFKVSRYSKPIKCISLKINDEVVTVSNDMGTDVTISTNNGYLLRYDINEISIIGIKGSGVKAITLKNDYVVSAHIFTACEYLTVITDKGTGKRIKLTEFEKTSRARKGILMVRDVKTNPYSILNTFITYGKESIGLKSKDEIRYIKNTELPIVDRYSTGTIISKVKISAAFLRQDLYEKNKQKEEIIEKEVSLKQVDEQIMTIDDFLDDFKIE